MAYRDSDGSEVEVLHSEIKKLNEENSKLKKQIEEFMGMDLTPYEDMFAGACKKCNMRSKGERSPDDAAKTDKILAWLGPTFTYEAAYEPSWFARIFLRKIAHPARMRRDCPACKAIYYEFPNNVKVLENKK